MKIVSTCNLAMLPLKKKTDQQIDDFWSRGVKLWTTQMSMTVYCQCHTLASTSELNTVTNSVKLG